jgi:voltage-gated potassium channel
MLDGAMVTRAAERNSWLEQYKDGWEWFLVGPTLIYLGAYSYEVLHRPQGSLLTIVVNVEHAMWAAFILDCILQWIYQWVLHHHSIEENKWWWVWPAILSVMAILPMLRPLRIIRLVFLITVLNKLNCDAFRGKVVTYTVLGAALLVYVASLAMLEAERDAPGSKIHTFPEAIWWSITTITTVGYGDFVPVTSTGRFVVASLLMLGAIGLVASITGALASWIVEHVADEKTSVESKRQEKNLAANIDKLNVRIDRLTQELQRHGVDPEGHQ